MPRTELRTEVEIKAPVARVFTILADLARYPEWNPFLTSVTGPLEIGGRLTVELSLPEGRSHVLRPEVIRVLENAELGWQSRFLFPSGLKLEHFLQLSERGAGVTRVVHGQNFSGWLLRWAGATLTLSARGCVYMNQALKRRAESML